MNIIRIQKLGCGVWNYSQLLIIQQTRASVVNGGQGSPPQEARSLAGTQEATGDVECGSPPLTNGG